MNGNIFFYSYRDPNLLETVDIYNTTSDFIMDLDLPRSELQRYIIGTIADLDNPMNARIKGEQAETNYFINNTYEQRLKVRQEVINTTIDDLRSLSEMFKALLGKQSLCVVGNERKIAENNQLFDYSYPLFS
jgi:presequence protease